MQVHAFANWGYLREGKGREGLMRFRRGGWVSILSTSALEAGDASNTLRTGHGVRSTGLATSTALYEYVLRTCAPCLDI